MTAFPERALVQSATEVKAWEKGLGICHEDLSVNLQEGHFSVGGGRNLITGSPKKSGDKVECVAVEERRN